MLCKCVHVDLYVVCPLPCFESIIKLLRYTASWQSPFSYDCCIVELLSATSIPWTLIIFGSQLRVQNRFNIWLQIRLLTGQSSMPILKRHAKPMQSSREDSCCVSLEMKSKRAQIDNHTNNNYSKCKVSLQTNWK